MRHLLDRSAVDIAAAVRGRQVTAVEVLDAHLERIAEVNGELNAIVTLCEEDAREAAKTIDRASAAKDPLPLLAGVPVTVKDVIATAGVRTTAGSRILQNFVPKEDATVVVRLREAGAVLIGKTNCSEFALDPHTDNRLFGLTRNALDPSVTPGGSSGGEGAAVAAGCSAFGLGTDYGGSVRWPAQCNGIHGLRPTVGLVSGTGLVPPIGSDRLPAPSSVSTLSRSLTVGPLAREPADLWAALSVLVGPDPRDPGSVPVPLGDPSLVDVASLSCAWCDGDGTTPVRSDLVNVVEHAAGTLGELGAQVEEARPPGLERAETIYTALRDADGLPEHQALVQGREDDLTESMRTWFRRVESGSYLDYRTLMGERDELRARALEFMDRHQILLLPVSTAPAYELDSADFASRFERIVPCRVITLLGFPALALTCGRSDEDQPVAVQIVGRPFHDHEVVAVASAIREAMPDA